MCCKCKKLEEINKDQTGVLSSLKGTLDHKNFTINSQGFIIKDQQSKIDILQEQLEWFKRQVFGPKSEKLSNLTCNNPALPGLDLPDEVVTEEVPVNEKVTVNGKRKKRKKGTCTLTLPDDIEVQVILKDLPESQRIDPVTGEVLVEIDREIVNKLASKPASYYIKRYIYIKYANPNRPLCGVVQQQAEDAILRGSKFDESFMADTVVKKLAYHIPFYRQQEMMTCVNIGIERQTLSSLFVNLGQQLKPLYSVLKETIFQCGYLHTDDTPARMLKPGNGKTVEVRMWAYEAADPNAPPYIIYDFSIDHKYEHPVNFMKNFNGVIHGDAFGAYVKLDKDTDNSIKWSACMAHARRKFFESEAGDQKFKKYILETMGEIYKYEKVAWLNSPATRLAVRDNLERPLVDEMFKKLWAKVQTERLLPKEKLTKAINYMLKYEKNFRMYLDDPNIKIDNNSGERAIRKIVIGKKNWMFVGSPKAGESMAILYSFVQSCRAIKIDPHKYLEDVFKRLNSHPHKNLAELLPAKWKIANNELPGPNK
jgi:transposase